MCLDFVLRRGAKTGRFVSGISTRERASLLLIRMFRSYAACHSRLQRMCCYRRVETRQLFYGMLTLGRPGELSRFSKASRRPDSLPVALCAILVERMDD